MKRFVAGSFLVLLVGLMTATAPQASAQQTGAQKIAFINSQLVLKQAPGFAAAESTFNREVEGFRAEATRLQTTVDSAAAAFNRDAVLLSPSAREAKRKDLETQQTTLETRMTELRDRSIAREKELLDPITSRVQTVIDGVRAEGNYSMIFDLSVLGSGVVSADKALDLTDTVIKRLQAGR
ncbi:MAG: OmpH family outer membrane protein [Gemmatimonadota bacterium]